MCKVYLMYEQPVPPRPFGGADEMISVRLTKKWILHRVGVGIGGFVITMVAPFSLIANCNY